MLSRPVSSSCSDPPRPSFGTGPGRDTTIASREVLDASMDLTRLRDRRYNLAKTNDSQSMERLLSDTQ